MDIQFKTKTKAQKDIERLEQIAQRSIATVMADIAESHRIFANNAPAILEELGTDAAKAVGFHKTFVDALESLGMKPERMPEGALIQNSDGSISLRGQDQPNE